ncbi:hypothetical protein G6F57_022115 [Rhizopus arrhizus]|nr:hypothetical protein G6F57_022115 [Rhizopus arrhizus]
MTTRWTPGRALSTSCSPTCWSGLRRWQENDQRRRLFVGGVGAEYARCGGGRLRRAGRPGDVRRGRATGTRRGHDPGHSRVARRGNYRRRPYLQRAGPPKGAAGAR